MQDLSDKSLAQLWKDVRHLSHIDFPFLHPIYSPSSRVPCADFSTFIIQCLRQGDIVSICKLMRQIIAENPGLGVGVEWVDKSVNEVVEIDFSRYFISNHPDTFLELKALFILASKDGGGREFWITDNKPFLFALALCCNSLTWLKEMAFLQEKANKFIRDMAKNIPYWEKYPLFTEEHFDTYTCNNPVVLENLLKLPLGARIHLLDFSKKGIGSLIQSTDYQMRSLGVNPIQTAPLIFESGMCIQSKAPESLTSVWSKDELIDILQNKNVQFKKSWNKNLLLEVLATNLPDTLVEAAEKEKTAAIKPEFSKSLSELREYAQSLTDPIKLLCFL